MIQFNNPLPNGGVPFFANDFNFMQDMQLTLFNIMLEQYYSILPPTKPSLILSGLTVSSTGSTLTSISSGYVILNKKVYWFEGTPSLSVNAPVYIVPGSPSEMETRPLENNSSGVVKIKNIATYTTTPPSGHYIRFNPFPEVNLSDLTFRVSKKIGEIIPLGTRYTPSHPLFTNPLLGPGGLQLFSTSGEGLFSYNGFQLCNGNNGTPDLRGRSMVGMGAYSDVGGSYSYSIGDTGGLSKVKLTDLESGLREHRHTYNSPVGEQNSGGRDNAANNDWRDHNSSGVHTVDGVGGRNGKQDAINFHENRPPYHALAFIQRIS